MLVLNEFPTADEFYKIYWGRKPFVVRGAIDAAAFEGFIDGDMLAGLSLEDEVKSRIVLSAPEGNKWTCEHGPFEEERFSTLGDKNWSLLVQNVEQYHTDTANLLKSFNFSPRWLMDDIMVSYSEAGGTVGPHTDSYHVFLVQGTGHRSWTVGDTPVVNEECIEGLDLKVLKSGVEGEAIEVTIGDVIYIPPHFAHEGKTLETAMTFSVGFLGPKMSELFAQYGHYLEQMEALDKRYAGQELNVRSAGFALAPHAQKTLRGELMNALHADSFSVWLAEYFSTSADVDEAELREDPLSSAELIARLQAGEVLYRPEHVKICTTTSQDGVRTLAVYGAVLVTTVAHDGLIEWLGQHASLSLGDVDALGNKDAVISVIAHLYNQNALFFEGDDPDH